VPRLCGWMLHHRWISPRPCLSMATVLVSGGSLVKFGCAVTVSAVGGQPVAPPGSQCSHRLAARGWNALERCAVKCPEPLSATIL
jgi:hypothetical protein